MFKRTRTIAFGSVNHQDRKEGATYAKLQNIPKSDIDTLAGWNEDTGSNYYDKYPRPDVVSQLAGFRNATSYFLPRSMATQTEFLKVHPEACNLFEIFFQFVDDRDTASEVERLAFEDGKLEEERVLNALKLVKTVFFQDICFLHDAYPGMKLFNQGPLQSEMESFLKWKRFVLEYNDRMELQNGASAMGDDVSRFQRLEALIVQKTTQSLTDLGAFKSELKDFIKDCVVETFDAIIGKKRKSIMAEEEQEDDSDDQSDGKLLQSLRKLRGNFI